MLRPIARRILRHRAVVGAARRLSGARLRVLAYHAVTDVTAFERQMQLVIERFRPVGPTEVSGWLHRGQPMPRGAVWITFDDGDPTIVEAAQPVLDRLGIPATMFATLGVLDGDEPFWWEIVERAEQLGIPVSVDRPAGVPALSALKTIPDRERRDIVHGLRETLAAGGESVRHRQLATADLERWLAAGHTVGNHSWDHPCLDRCDPEALEAQIRRSHRRLVDIARPNVLTFAYPNGSDSPAAQRLLAQLGYEVAVLFDHRLTARRPEPLRLSRLRVDADAPIDRFRTIMSGAHSAALTLARRAR